MRRGLRFVAPALLLAVVVEVTVFVVLGRSVGFGPAVLAVLVASLAGLWLLRREGVRAWRGLRAAAGSGQPPGRQVTDGLVGLAAGGLLAAPGLVSGVVGLVLVVPPVRRAAGVLAARVAQRRMSSMVAAEMFGPRRVRVRQGAPTAGPAPQPTAEPGAAIEGEIISGR
ncbi:FxsA family protein [Micromonospora sp. CPCC 206060]|uniref:FxsA family protein n=1 Tax=Micromonospora sp. CPCC 206060 TaxID=3122406 RepID=UPI002FF05650